MQPNRSSLPPAISPTAFVFTDIVDSTSLIERLGDRRFALLMRDHNELVRRLLRRHGGSEGAFLGDGFLLAFAQPADAVAFAAALRREARRLLPNGVRLRIGAHVGTAVRQDGTWIGRDVVVARRLCDLAAAGEVLISAQLRALAGAPGAEPGRSVPLKGLGREQVAWALEAA